MQPPEFEDEATLFSLSTEFLEAAAVLHSSAPVKVNVSIVTFYLLGHSAELLLKSFLHKRGVQIAALRKKEYGHNLAQLVKTAQSHGLSPSINVQYIVQLSDLYASKRTEYRKNVGAMYPPLDFLLSEVQSLQRHVFDHVAEF